MNGYKLAKKRYEVRPYCISTLQVGSTACGDNLCQPAKVQRPRKKTGFNYCEVCGKRMSNVNKYFCSNGCRLASAKSTTKHTVSPFARDVRQVEVVFSIDELLKRVDKAKNTDFILYECKGESGRGMSWAAVKLKWDIENYYEANSKVEK